MQKCKCLQKSFKKQVSLMFLLKPLKFLQALMKKLLLVLNNLKKMSY